MSVVLLDQEIVHYEVLGRGRPIIFLHGWVGSWRYWIPSMQAASVSFRAYAIDLWGFGDTAKNSRQYSLDHQAQLLDGFLDEMGIGRAALVGHGLGALVAMYYALQHADFIDRLLLVSLPVDENGLSGRLRSASTGELSDWLLGRSTLTEAARTDAPKADGQAIQTSLNDLAAFRLKEKWNQLTTACLLVNGQNDPAVESPRLEQALGLPEHVHSVVFDQSGHFPMLDEASKFNRLLGDFLALPSGESPRQLQLKEEWKRRVR